MNLSYDVIVAGGGLAGACAALHLSRSRRVLLLEAGRKPSGPAAGLVNPLMSQRGRPVWRMEEALDALHATLDLAGATDLFRPGGVLRPAPDEKQARFFREAAEEQPAHAHWLTGPEAAEHYPAVRAPLGALLVTTGGALPFPRLLGRITEAAIRNGTDLRTGATVTGFGETGQGAWVEVLANPTAQFALDRGRETPLLSKEGPGVVGAPEAASHTHSYGAARGGESERLHAEHVILALGGGWTGHPELQSLRLHSVKGQTVEVRPPARLDLSTVPHLAGAGYVVSGADALVLGSSYEHAFTDLHPSPKQTAEIMRKAEEMLPALRGAEILSESVGVRVTVPGVRLPMLGPLPGRERVWVFTGLASKGLLMAPLLARELAGCLDAPERIPEDLRVRTAAPK